MVRASKYWEIEGVVEALDKGWESKSDVAKDRTKDWIRSNVTNTTTFLDVGCGTGFFAKTASDICGPKNYLGIDLTQKMLNFCKNKYPDLRFEQGNILDLSSIPDKSFDIVMSCDVLMHLYRDNCIVALRELYRIARDKILIKTPLTDGDDYGREEVIKDDLERPYWIGYNKDRFVRMLKDIMSKDDIITVHRSRDLKSGAKKDCYWALIEVVVA